MKKLMEKTITIILIISVLFFCIYKTTMFLRHVIYDEPKPYYEGYRVPNLELEELENE